MARCLRTICLIVVAVGSAAVARAAEYAYYDVPIQELKLTDGKLPGRSKPDRWDWRRYELSQTMRPYATVDGDGEAFLAGDRLNDPWSFSYSSPGSELAAHVLIRAV